MSTVSRLGQLVAHSDLNHIRSGDSDNVDIEIPYLPKVQPHSISGGQLIGQHPGCNSIKPVNREVEKDSHLIMWLRQLWFELLCV